MANIILSKNNAKENIQNLAQKLQEVSLDVIDTQAPVMVSHWFKAGDELDVNFIVRGENNIIKQQVCLYGQVVEWNEYEGIKTGFVQETESLEDSPVQEIIRFDLEVNKISLEQSIEVLESIVVINSKWRQKMLANFKGKEGLLPSEQSAWSKLVSMVKSITKKSPKI